MTIVLESQDNAEEANGATSVTLTKPTGVVSGDVLVAACRTNGAPVMSPPSGWVEMGQVNSNNRNMGQWYLVAGGSEPATYAFTWTGGQNAAQGWIGRFSGVDNSTPEDVAASTNTGGSNSTPVALSVTTANANAFLIESITHNGTATLDASDLTEIFDQGDVADQLHIAGDIQAGAGASGNKSATISANRNWTTIMGALREDAGGATRRVFIIS